MLFKRAAIWYSRITKNEGATLKIADLTRKKDRTIRNDERK